MDQFWAIVNSLDAFEVALDTRDVASNRGSFDEEPPDMGGGNGSQFRQSFVEDTEVKLAALWRFCCASQHNQGFWRLVGQLLINIRWSGCD